MFSSRITSDLSPNRLTEALRRRRSEGLPVIDLTESNPTRAGFEYPPDLLAPLADRRGLTYTPEPLGLMETREAVAREYERRGVHIGPERIALTASTSEAYSVLFKLLASPGDEVLVPTPSYPLLDRLTALDGVVARPYALDYHGTWSIDFDTVEGALSARTRAVVLVSPNNPTGSFVPQHELDRLAALCAARNMALIADEVFADYELAHGRAKMSGSVLSREDVLAFGLGGLSKSIGLPQVKLGWIALSGPARLVGEALQRLEVVCDAYLSVSTSVQLAAPQLLSSGAEMRSQISERILSNYRRLNELAASAPSARVLAAEGGWYAVVQVPTLESEEELVVTLLSNDGVLTHPGYYFDFARESYLVLSLLPSEGIFTEGAGRLLARAAQASE